MKKKSGNDQLVIAAHCASGFHLFDMETNDPIGTLNIVCKKIEAFACVMGFGYFVPDEGQIFIFNQG